MSGPKTFSPVVPACTSIDPFQMRRKESEAGEKKIIKKQRGLPSDVETRGEEGSGLARLALCVGFPLLSLHPGTSVGV